MQQHNRELLYCVAMELKQYWGPDTLLWESCRANVACAVNVRTQRLTQTKSLGGGSKVQKAQHASQRQQLKTQWLRFTG
jgi:hypothetical protein